MSYGYTILEKFEQTSSVYFFDQNLNPLLPMPGVVPGDYDITEPDRENRLKVVSYVGVDVAGTNMDPFPFKGPPRDVLMIDNVV